jgi:hypothetical protein
MGMVYFLRVGSMNNDRRTSALKLDTARKKAIDILKTSTNRYVFIEREYYRAQGKKTIAKSDIIGYVTKDGKDWRYNNMEKKITQYLRENGKPYTYH